MKTEIRPVGLRSICELTGIKIDRKFFSDFVDRVERFVDSRQSGDLMQIYGEAFQELFEDVFADSTLSDVERSARMFVLGTLWQAYAVEVLAAIYQGK